MIYLTMIVNAKEKVLYSKLSDDTRRNDYDKAVQK